MGQKRYDAFVSYSTDPDRDVAVALQDGLRNLYNPWYRPGKFMEVFRDETSMGSGGGLADKIYRGLDSSEHLVVLLSPQAIDPDGYVNDEIKYWRAHPEHREERPDDQSIIAVVTSWGETTGDADLPSLGDFDWGGKHVPEGLHGVFANDDKPLAVDMRWAHLPDADLALDNPVFYKNIAAIAAGIRGVSPETFDKDLRSQKLRAKTLIGTIALGIAVLLGTIGLALVGWAEARTATGREQAKAAAAAEEADAARDETAAANADLNAVNSKLDSAEIELSQETAKLNSAQDDLTAKQSELATAQNDLDSALTQKDAADAAVVAANTRLDAALDEVEVATAEAAAANTRVAAANTKLAAANTELDAANTRVEAANTELDAANTRVASANADLAVAVSGRDAAEVARAAAQRQVDDLGVQLAVLTTAVAEADARLAAAQQELVATQESLQQTQLVEEATDLAVQSAAASARSDAALGVVLAVESVLTVDPPLPASYRALASAREALANSSWQQVGGGLEIAPLQRLPAVDSCFHDGLDRRPLRLIRGTALTPDGEQLLVNTPHAIDAISTSTRQRRTVLESVSAICGFDVTADGSSVTMVQATTGDAVLSTVDIATGAVTWSTVISDMTHPSRVDISADGRVAVEGQRRTADTDNTRRSTRLFDPSTRAPIEPWLGGDFGGSRIATFDEQLLLYTGGDSFPAGLFSLPQVDWAVYERDPNPILADFEYGDWGRVSIVPDPAGGSILVADDRGQLRRQGADSVAPWSGSGTTVNGLSNPLVVDPGNRRVYVGSLDGKVTVFDLQSLQPLAEFQVAGAEIESLALDVGSQSLWVTAGNGTTINVSLATSDTPLREFSAFTIDDESPGDASSINVTPDGERLLVHNNRAFRPPSESAVLCGVDDYLHDWTAITEVATGDAWLERHRGLDPLRPPAVNDRHLVAYQPGECWVQITNLGDRSRRYVEFGGVDRVQALDLAETDDRVVVATQGQLWTMDVSDAAPNPIVLATDSAGIVAIDVSDDGTIIATFDGTTITIRSGADGSIVRSDVGAGSPVDDFALSHDGRRLAVQVGTRLDVWNLTAGTLEQALDTAAAAGTGLDFSRDGRFLAAGGGSLVWATRGWEPMRVRIPRTVLRDVVFSGAGPTLAAFGQNPSGDGLNKVWITDALDPAAGCAAAVPLLEGRTSEIDDILRGDRTQRACQ